MNKGTILGIAIGAGVPCILILIGLIGLLVKFFMKRCQKKAWDEISSLPKNIETEDNMIIHRPVRQLSAEREPLRPSNVAEGSDGHITVPINENDLSIDQEDIDYTIKQEHTLVQIQRDRLKRLKEEEQNFRSTMTFAHSEDDIQHAIDQAQKEFEESEVNASAK